MSHIIITVVIIIIAVIDVVLLSVGGDFTRHGEHQKDIM